MDGGGVAVVEVAGAQVLGWAASEDRTSDVDDQVGAVEPDDRAPGAVDHTEAPGVAQAHHLVAGRERPPVRLATQVGTDGAATLQHGPGLEIEGGDVAPVDRQHEGVVPRLPGRQPASDQVAPRLGHGVGEPDPPVVVVGAQGIGDIARAQLVESGPLPQLALAAVLGELEGTQARGQGAEGSAGLDLGELAGIADQHQLGSRLLGHLHQPGQGAGPDHPGLVDHHHVT